MSGAGLEQSSSSGQPSAADLVHNAEILSSGVRSLIANNRPGAVRSLLEIGLIEKKETCWFASNTNLQNLLLLTSAKVIRSFLCCSSFYL